MGHSLGGRVVLRMLASRRLRAEYGDVLARVDSSVLLSPLDVGVERTYPDFERIASLSDFESGLATMFGELRRSCARATHEHAADAARMPREEVDRLVQCLDDPRRRRAARAMLRHAVPFRDNGRPDFDRIRALERDYRNVDVPCLLIWGARDEALPLSMGYKIAAALPEAWLRVLPDGTHALPIECPRVCSELARRFAAEGGLATESRVARLPSNPAERPGTCVEDRIVLGPAPPGAHER